MFNTQTPFFRSVAFAISFVLCANSTVLAADSITQGAQEANIFGGQLNQKNYLPTQQGDVLTMPSSGQGNPVQLNTYDLYPGSSSSNQRPSSYYFPDSGAKTVDEMQGAFGSESSIKSMGNQSTQALGSDALSPNPSLGGIAYQIVQDAANEPIRDMNNDPIFNQTKDVYRDIDIIAKEFGDCREETSYFNTSFQAHSPDYVTCERMPDTKDECKISHRYSANFIEHHGGPYNIQPSGDNAISVWIGRVGDNYWSGWCTIFEQTTELKVVKPEAITKVTLEYVKYDDYMQVYIGKPGQEVKVWQGPNSNFPPEVGDQCELSTSWEQSPNVDVTPYFKNIDADSVVRFKFRVSVAGEGEGYGRLRIDYDPQKAIVTDEWDEGSCSTLLTGINDGFATGTKECTTRPLNEENGCAIIDGIKICEEYLKPAPIPEISPLCQEVTVKGKFTYAQGQMDCYTDANGNRQCPINNGSIKNSCGEYENNPQCGFIKSECVNGATGASGTCYVSEDTYDCGFTTTVPTIEAQTNYVCPGAIRCMGSECINPEKTTSKDFARVSALLQAAHTMGQDLSCSGTNEDGTIAGDEDVTCKVFAGKHQECKKAVGGIVNCCEKPKGISLADYVGLLLAVPKLDAALVGLEKTDTTFRVIGSAYKELRQPVVDAFQSISKPFSGLIDNISGAIDTVSTAIDGVVDQIKGKITEMFNTVFGNTAASTGVGSAGGAAAGELAKNAGEQVMENVMAAYSVISTVYTVYAVTMLVIKMIYKCTKDELELNVNRVLKNTHYIGSYCRKEVLGMCVEKREVYCVYKSPLSRILQEQIRRQLGRTFGTTEEPDCGGLSISDFEEVDWTMVNLDEWLAILGETGNLKDPATMSLMALTGSGTTLDLGSRVAADERTFERFEGIDVEKIRRDSGNMQGAPIIKP